MSRPGSGFALTLCAARSSLSKAYAAETRVRLTGAKEGGFALRTHVRPDDTDNHEPPKPADILARLGALVAIALGFGFVAQLLVGVPH